MKTLELKVNPKEFGLEEKEAAKITNGLTTILEERQVLIDAYKDVIELEITEENIKTFKELRLMIVKNRTTGLNVWHKTNKAYFLAGGNFVQAIYNKEVAENERMESALMEAEKHFENLEKERIATIQKERELELEKYEVENVSNLNLGYMSDEIWTNFLEGTKLSYNNKIAEQKRIEEERIAKEKAEAERIRLQEIENAKLKAEAEKREKEIEAERKANEEKLRIEREKAEVERKRIEAENNAKLKAEQEAKAKIEAELKAKKDAEIKAENERKDAEMKALKEAEKLKKAPIKNQLNAWVNSFELPSTNVDNDVSREIIKKFNAFKKWAIVEINNI